MLVAPTPYKEAAAFIAGKPVVSRAVFAKLLPALKGRAFVIAGIEAASVLQNVRDTIAMLPQGGDWEEIKATVLEHIDPYFIDPEADAETQAAQGRAAARRAELLLRTHGQQAYMAGLYSVADAQRDLFPFWQYQSLGDGNVRPSHAALDGIVLPANHEFWQTHTPPWDWGCRCKFIPISEETAQEMRDADKNLPLEKKRVIEGELLTKLENERTLWRPRNLATGEGDPVPYNVQSPKEAGKEGAFEWNPADLTLTPAQLKDRYDPEVWSQFEGWAKQAEIEEGKTVWAWMNGADSVAQPAPSNAPADDASEPFATPPPRKSPVSSAIALAVMPAIMEHGVKRALAAVDAAHDDGVLPEIPVQQNKRLTSALGTYTKEGAKAVAIDLAPGMGAWTALEELGHFLDHKGLGFGSQFGSEAEPSMRKLAKALAASRPMKALKRRHDRAQTNKHRARLAAAMQGREVFARAYAQWVAVKSGDAYLLRALAAERAAKPDFYWSDEEFAAVQTELEAVFLAKGWL